MAKTEKELEKELAELKSKYSGKAIFRLDTFIDEEEDQQRTLFLTKPNRMTRTAAEKIALKDSWKGVETFIRGMYIGGDDVEEVCKNDDALMIAGECIVEIIKLKAGNVQKV